MFPRLRGWLKERRTRRWAEAHVLGGFAAYEQARDILRRSVAEGKRRLRDKVEAERKLAWWSTWERERDENLLDSLALVVPPRTDEDPVAYDDRLWAIVSNLRGRLEAPPPLAFVASAATNHHSAPSRAGSEEAPQVVVLSRAQIRSLNRRIWSQYRRRPTPQEMREEARRIGAI